jgi:hypothetical protein
LDDVSLLVAENFEPDIVVEEDLIAYKEVVMVLLAEMDLVVVLTVVLLLGSEALVLLDDDFEAERDETLETLAALDVGLVGEDFELEREDLLEVFVVLDVELLDDNFWPEVAGALKLRIEDTLAVFDILEMLVDEVVLLVVIDLELESNETVEVSAVLDGVLLDEILLVDDKLVDFIVLDDKLVDDIALAVGEDLELESDETLEVFVVLDKRVLGEETLLLDILETFELELKRALEVLERMVDEILVLVVDEMVFEVVLEVVFEVDDAILTHGRAVSVE